MLKRIVLALIIVLVAAESSVAIDSMKMRRWYWGGGNAAHTLFESLYTDTGENQIYVLKRGTGPTTFARTGSKVITDWEDVLIPVSNTDEITYTGARRIENLLADDSSDDFSVWGKGGTATVTDTNILNFPNANDSVFQTLLTGVSVYKKTFTYSIDLSGSGTTYIWIYRVIGTETYKSSSLITLSSTPVRYSITHTMPHADNVSLQVRIQRSAGSTATQVIAENAMLEEVTGQSNTNPSNYVSTMTADPVSGVKGVTYSLYENGNTVASNVVTEATGAALTTYKGFSYEPDSTNKCENHNIIGPDMLDSETVVNGDASDTTSTDSSVAPLTGWTNTGTHDASNKVTIGSGQFTLISDGTFMGIKPTAINVGKRYRLSIDVISVTSGSIRLFDNAAGVHWTSSGTGVQTADFVPGQTTVTLALTGSAATNVTFDDVSIKELGASDSTGSFVSGLGTGTIAEHDGSWTGTTPDFINPIPGMTLSGGEAESATMDSGNLTVGKKYKITAQDGEDFTTDGAPDNNVNTEFIATGTNVTLDANDTVVELTYPATLEIVDDLTALAAAGLDRIVPSGKVYKLDNSTGGVVAITVVSGGPANTNPYSYSVYSRESAGNGRLAQSSYSWNLQMDGSAYDRYIENRSAADAGNPGRLAIAADAGGVVYFTLNQLEELTTATAPIRVEGASASRNADVIKWPIADGTNYVSNAGTLTSDITFGFDSTDIPNGINVSLLSVADWPTTIFYLRREVGGQLKTYSYDATSAVGTNLSEFSKGDTVTFKTTWSTTLNKLNNYSSTDGWGASAAYDGSFALATHWRVGYSAAYPFSIENIEVTRSFNTGGL